MANVRGDLTYSGVFSEQNNVTWREGTQSQFGSVGETVTEAHFGSGFEFHRHEVTDESTLSLAVEQVGLGFLRYPGGTQTENYFDLENPDNPEPTALFNNAGTTTEVTPLSEFLSFAEGRELSCVIVIPTWRYFNQQTRNIDPQAEGIVKNFVTDLLSGTYGSPNIHAFEIGNEWFNSAYDWTALEFGAVQRAIAVWVNEAIEDASTENSPSIWIQSGQQGSRDFDRNGVNDNVEFLEAFSAEDLQAVDGLIDHFYQPTRYENVMDDQYLDNPWVATSRVDRLREDGWTVDGPNALDIVTTEWNIRADRPGNITGLERSPMLLRLFCDMLQAGVDVSMIWTTEALGVGAGSLFQQGEDGLTPTGLLFQMMMNSLAGARLIDPNGDGEISTDEITFSVDSVENAGYFFAFAQDGRLVVYIASGVNESIEMDADFSAFAGSGYHLHGSLLSVRSGNDPTAVDADGVINSISALRLEGNQRDDGLLSFELNPFEVLQLEFSWNRAQDLRGDWHTTTNDELLGTGESDQIHGYAGDDYLRGYSGDDAIDGGSGRDRIWGGNGADVIHGGPGRDIVYGGNGNDIVWLGPSGDMFKGGRLIEASDRVYGGQGKDRIFAGNGNDTVSGGNGDDTLSGGFGDDVLEGGLGDDTFHFRSEGNSGVDTILDFSPGEDVLRVIGASSNEILFSEVENGTVVTWRNGQVELEGVSLTDLCQDDFLFI